MSAKPQLSLKEAMQARDARVVPGSGAIVAPVEPAKPVEPLEKPKPTIRGYEKQASRLGKRPATAYISPEALRQLKKLALDEDRSAQELIIEAINDLFVKYDLPRLA